MRAYPASQPRVRFLQTGMSAACCASLYEEGHNRGAESLSHPTTAMMR